MIAGDFWDETRDDLQVSFDAEAAAKFGLEIGDAVELRILGEPATARIANLRDIDWRSLNVNFVMIFSRPPLPDLPFGYFAGVFAPDEATPVLQREIAERFPNITPVAVAGIIERIKGLLSRAAQLARLMGLFLLAGGAIVAALAVIEHRQRRFAEILALRIVGAGERRVARIAAVEFAALGLMSALPALVFGALAGARLSPACSNSNGNGNGRRRFCWSRERRRLAGSAACCRCGRSCATRFCRICETNKR